KFRHLWLAPEEVPSQPLALRAYDTLVLHPGALVSLAARQLDATAQWVDAGGTLVILLAPSAELPPVLKPELLLPFLNRLTRDTLEHDWVQSPDAEIARLKEAPLFFHAGCGRVMLFHDP